MTRQLPVFRSRGDSGLRNRARKQCVADIEKIAVAEGVGVFLITASTQATHRLEKKSRRLQPWMVVDSPGHSQTMSGHSCRSGSLQTDLAHLRLQGPLDRTRRVRRLLIRQGPLRTGDGQQGLSKTRQSLRPGRRNLGGRGAAELDSERVVLRAGVVLAQEN